MNYVWDERIEYLFNTRKLMWNNDYMGFLIQNVWKIDKPVDVIDFGCAVEFDAAGTIQPLYFGIIPSVGIFLVWRQNSLYSNL